VRAKVFDRLSVAQVAALRDACETLLEGLDRPAVCDRVTPSPLR